MGLIININPIHSDEVEILMNERSLKDSSIMMKPPCKIEYTQHTWIPSKPINAKIKVSMENNTYTVLTIILVFKHGGFRVKWNSPKVLDNEINIYVEVEEWTGESMQIITKKENSYNLGILNPGTYTVKLYVNEKLFSEETFKIQDLSTTLTSTTPTNTTYPGEQEINDMKYLFIGIGAAIFILIVILIKILKPR